jgi:hypothetical protein
MLPSSQEDALQRGVTPRATDYDGNTLLHASCSRGSLRAAKLVVRWAVGVGYRNTFHHVFLQSKHHLMTARMVPDTPGVTTLEDTRE